MPSVLDSGKDAHGNTHGFLPLFLLQFIVRIFLLYDSGGLYANANVLASAQLYSLPLL